MRVAHGDDPEVPHLRVVDDLVDRVDRCKRRTSFAPSVSAQYASGRREKCASSPCPAPRVLDPLQASREAWIGSNLVGADRCGEALPELLERGQVDRNQLRVGRAQDVGLREPRAVARRRRLAEREVCGERLDREVRHRLEHGHLDETTGARAASLEQRAEHAVRRVDTRDRVGERGTMKRALRIDDDAQESAQRPRNRVAARAFAYGPVPPKP